MKKWSVRLIGLGLLLMLLPLTARAAEQATVTAASVTAQPGQTISVPVTIRGNTGFTNFSLRVGYEEKALELMELRPGTLCGELTRVNQNHLVSARAQAVEENGTLVTAVFQVREGYTGTATVTVTADYVRCADETGENFQDLTIITVPGSVRVENTGEEKPEGELTLGDLNGDGRINALDAALAYGHLAGVRTLPQQQLAAADVDGNGIVDRSDAIWLYRYVTKRTTAFPKALEGE